MISPYAFIRIVTFGLATTWSVFAVLRMIRIAEEWKQELAPLGLEESWWRRQITIACLRATVLDPLNLALGCALIALWTITPGG